MSLWQTQIVFYKKINFVTNYLIPKSNLKGKQKIKKKTKKRPKKNKKFDDGDDDEKFISFEGKNYDHEEN